MANKVEEKKIFLLASASESQLEWYQNSINRHISKATIFTAKDGITALSKLQNAPPHSLIVDVDLPKLSGLQLVDHCLQTKGAERTGIVISGPPPEQGQHLDELVTGKVHYFTAGRDENEFMQVVAKALNFATHHNEEAEFYLRILAAGDMLLKEGDRADFVYFVKKGQLSAFKGGVLGEVQLGLIEYGEFVGEMAFINGEPRSASVRANTDCELIEVPIAKFSKVLYARPAWSKALMLTLSKRVRAANSQKAKVE